MYFPISQISSIIYGAILFIVPFFVQAALATVAPTPISPNVKTAPPANSNATSVELTPTPTRPPTPPPAIIYCVSSPI